MDFIIKNWTQEETKQEEVRYLEIHIPHSLLIFPSLHDLFYWTEWNFPVYTSDCLVSILTVCMKGFSVYNVSWQAQCFLVWYSIGLPVGRFLSTRHWFGYYLRHFLHIGTFSCFDNLQLPLQNNLFIKYIIKTLYMDST